MEEGEGRAVAAVVMAAALRDYSRGGVGRAAGLAAVVAQAAVVSEEGSTMPPSGNLAAQRLGFEGMRMIHN
jgi:hypothetical protein